MPFEFTRLHRIGPDRAVVATRPPKQNAVFLYPFHRLDAVRNGGVWLLGKPRDEYTHHALSYARQKLDGPLVPRCVAPSQSGLGAHSVDELNVGSRSPGAADDD